jgi:hypothetical protein
VNEEAIARVGLQRHMKKKFIQSTNYSCQILVKLEFHGQIFEKYSNIKFIGNPSSGRRVVADRQTDREK